ncbi:hypothetical protein GCM10027098_12090 [Bowmanella dokdonensis]
MIGLVIWLLMNSYSADLAYRSYIRAGREMEWTTMWLYYSGWWMPWAVISPLIVAGTRIIPLDMQRWKLTVLKLVIMTAVSFLGFLLLAVPLVASFELGGAGLEKLQEALLIMVKRGAWHMDFLVYVAVVSVGYITQFYEKARKEEARSESLLRQLMQLELQSLKSQLNPHFLFNTLNTVASLIRLDKKDQAVKALSELSLMLRKVLENQSNQLINLAQEMDFINSYLTIQKMRFDKKLQTRVEVEPACLREEVPFMLLQPLVENAVQHGSQLESDQNLLDLRVSCSPGKLHIRLINKVPEQDEHHGFGIGLKNCRERLQKLYGREFELTLSKLDSGYFETYVMIPTGGDDD